MRRARMPRGAIATTSESLAPQSGPRRRPGRIGLICLAGTLLLGCLAPPAIGSGPPPALNANSMIEVRALSRLSYEVRGMLGGEDRGPAGIADAFERFNKAGAADSSLPMRRFIVAGESINSVLVAYEQGGRSYSVHASAFIRDPSGWQQAGHWVLSRRPTDLRTLLDLMFPERAGRVGREIAFYKRLGAPPARRLGPLRDTNISDEEVREVEAVVRQTIPGAIVDIEGVVTGCDCGDGPACSEQVWIVAYRPERSRGLQLSRIGGHWTIGPVQQWWLDYDALNAAARRFPTVSAYQAALNDMLERFPACENESPRPASAVAGGAVRH